MDIHKALYQARQLMNQHGLQTWGIAYSNRYSNLGHCDYRTQTIYLSKPHTFKGTEERVRNTILHEIAHASTRGHHHDEVWRAKAIEIGCTGDRCTSVADELMPESRYNVVCSVHGTRHQVNKMPRKPTSCGKCSQVWDPRYQLKVVLNPKYLEDRAQIDQ